MNDEWHTAVRDLTEFERAPFDDPREADLLTPEGVPYAWL